MIGTEIDLPAAMDETHDLAAGCKGYFNAIAARDLEAVLEAMTPDYARQLRDMRRLPEFDALFSLWCAAQGRLISVLSSSIRGDWASAALDTHNAVVLARLRRIGGRWLIDSERIAQPRTRSASEPAKARS